MDLIYGCLDDHMKNAYGCFYIDLKEVIKL